MTFVRPQLYGPGVYVQEVPSGNRTITGVATSIALFAGRTIWGPVNQPVTLSSFDEFQQRFGGLLSDSPMTYAVEDFFNNGGSIAIIARLFKAPDGAKSAGVARIRNLVTVTHDSIKALQQGTQAAQTGLSDVASAAGSTSPDTTALSQKLATARSALSQATTSAADSRRYIQDLGDRGQALSNLGAIQQIFQQVGAALAAADPSVNKSTDSGARDALAKTLKEAQDSLAKVNGLVASITAALPAPPAAATPNTPSGPNSPATPANGSGTAKDPNAITLVAASPGAWGERLSFITDRNGITDSVKRQHKTATYNGDDLFNLTLFFEAGLGVRDREVFRNVSLDPNSGSCYLPHQLDQRSRFARVAPTDFPASDAKGEDSVALDDTTYQRGLDAVLPRVPLFNLICIPPDDLDGSTSPQVYSHVLPQCVKRSATLILDAPSDWGGDNIDLNTLMPDSFAALLGVDVGDESSRYAALYYPRVLRADPIRKLTRVFPASGMIAGVIARTDTRRGVWKAPAGLEAGLVGAQGLERQITDQESQSLNQIGVNCLRTFTSSGPVIWGARTTRGSDQLSDDYKYLPVRRLADYIEQSLLRGTRWAVFEPNDEPLWAQLRLSIGSFMADLFKQGAFKGSTQSEAYYVRCDSNTTTSSDIDQGIVNVQIGFAPSKPAEFVILYLQQLAGKPQN
jgi:phage tail sheath protein FI